MSSSLSPFKVTASPRTPHEVKGLPFRSPISVGLSSKVNEVVVPARSSLGSFWAVAIWWVPVIFPSCHVRAESTLGSELRVIRKLSRGSLMLAFASILPASLKVPFSSIQGVTSVMWMVAEVVAASSLLVGFGVGVLGCAMAPVEGVTMSSKARSSEPSVVRIFMTGRSAGECGGLR